MIITITRPGGIYKYNHQPNNLHVQCIASTVCVSAFRTALIESAGSVLGYEK